ncbi:MAG: caspase family protein [Lewinellaceae bacterium]|nr:caspase family protein [Lewinellaceae bacterium]
MKASNNGNKQPWDILSGLLPLWVATVLVIAGTSGIAQIKPLIKEGSTRAVIVGISDYANISDLRFADRDAKEFAAFLQSPAGGNIPAADIKLMVNEQATAVNMFRELTWLVQECQPGDRAIIYFSGHGDMETISGFSYLLNYEVLPAMYPVGGAVQIDLLKRILLKLSTEKETQVMLITDACHAGKLAGSDIGGSQATIKVLSDQFNKEILILSCKADQFSVEGEQWGGGRGVFSYFLVDGLKGLADSDDNGEVTLFELKRYLEDEVYTAAKPNPQRPQILGGNDETLLATVDVATLAAVRQRRETTTDAKAMAVRSKAPDTTGQELLMAFQQAIARGDLLEPVERSAFALYQRALKRPELQGKQPEMRSNLAGALEQEAQGAIFDYLSTDPKELRRRWDYDPRYTKYPQYLATSADLLGEDHITYNQVRAKQWYFSGLNQRLAADREPTEAAYRQALDALRKTLRFDSTAVYAYNEIGLIWWRLQQRDSAAVYLKRALETSPKWTLPMINLNGMYNDGRDYQQGAAWGAKSLALDSTVALAHYNYAVSKMWLEDYPEAIKHYLQVTKLDPEYHNAWYNLGYIYRILDSTAFAEKYFLEYAQREPEDGGAYNNLGLIFITLDPQRAIPYFKKAAEVDPDYPYGFYYLGQIYMRLGDWPAGEAAMQKYIRMEPDDPDGYYDLACLFALQQKAPTALEWLEKALQKGFSDREHMLTDEDLASVRELPTFMALLNRYLPEK